MSEVIRRFVIAALFGFLAPAVTHAGPVLTYSSGTQFEYSAGSYTVGWSFTTGKSARTFRLTPFS
jgi:hypothetical protein